MRSIAVLGLGKMGSALAGRLMQRGYSVFIWNRTGERAKGLISMGATWLNNPEDAGRHCNIVLSMVADDMASDNVWLSDHGALKNLTKDSFVIECSTLSLDHVTKLSEICEKRELNYIDCPVTGLPAAAVEGKLTLLIGAESKTLERIRPVLEDISSKLIHFGGIGTGTSYKLMINLMGAVQIAALAEGIAMTEKLGLDRNQVIQAIESSAASSPQVLRYVRPMIEKKFSSDPVFSVGLRHKDASYGVRLAESLGCNAQLGRTALSWFALANDKNEKNDEAIVINEML